MYRLMIEKCIWKEIIINVRLIACAESAPKKDYVSLNI